ncbi:transposase [Endozoicomonas lisbonensis]|uniref:Transposase n=1 Tax=Endozoicomonas lisbonensis TaxID=3120522 RepID=A0ABV2SFS6_9GAMM
MAKRKNCSQEYKLKAVKLITEQGQSPAAVARSLGVSAGNLHRWVRAHDERKDQAFPDKGKQALTIVQQRIKELEAENKQLKMEQEILKKAMAFFAKDQL